MTKILTKSSSCENVNYNVIVSAIKYSVADTCHAWWHYEISFTPEYHFHSRIMAFEISMQQMDNKPFFRTDGIIGTKIIVVTK